MYKIVGKVLCSEMIHGRAMSCFIVKQDKKKYILKDAYMMESCWPDKVHFFVKAAKHGIKGLPTLIDWEDVPVDQSLGIRDSTALMTGLYPNMEIQIHCRLLFKGIGQPIVKFRSK